MPSSKISRHLLIALVIIGCLRSPASAGTIRHDPLPGSDTLWSRIEAHLDLALEYGSVGRVAVSAPEGIPELPGTPHGIFGSGTLIAPNWMLTAAHLVGSPGVETVALTFDYPDPGAVEYEATNWIAHPSFDWEFFSGYDIALVQFEENIAELAGVEPVERYRGKKEAGQIGTSVGFGAFGDGNTGAILPPLWKLAGQNKVDAWIPKPGRKADARILLSDFDKPGDPTESSWRSPKPLDLEHLIAPGDSGGGLFIEDKQGGDLLAGVHSFVWGILDEQANSDYGDVSGHTRVSPFNEWIDGILNGELGEGGGISAGQRLDGQAAAAWTALNAAVVPEPSTLCLLCIGGLCLLGRLWRRKRP